MRLKALKGGKRTFVEVPGVYIHGRPGLLLLLRSMVVKKNRFGVRLFIAVQMQLPVFRDSRKILSPIEVGRPGSPD